MISLVVWDFHLIESWLMSMNRPKGQCTYLNDSSTLRSQQQEFWMASSSESVVPSVSILSLLRKVFPPTIPAKGIYPQTEKSVLVCLLPYWKLETAQSRRFTFGNLRNKPHPSTVATLFTDPCLFWFFFFWGPWKEDSDEHFSEEKSAIFAACWILAQMSFTTLAAAIKERIYSFNRCIELEGEYAHQS
jgi:hypothetical protein